MLNTLMYQVDLRYTDSSLIGENVTILILVHIYII